MVKRPRPKQDMLIKIFYVVGAMDGNREGSTETIPQVPDRSCRHFTPVVLLVTNRHPDAGNVPAE